MSSWKEKLANKTSSAVAKPEPSFTASSTPSTQSGGWKQRINEKNIAPEQHRPAISKISIDDLNDFPALGGGNQPTKKQSALTGFATLAREWSEHAKEEKEREDKEKNYRDQQAYAYNYNISKLSAINNRLMEFNSYSQVKYDDEYNADYEKDLSYHNDHN